MIYLDNNATTRPLPEVVEAVRTALVEHWANPSSLHRAGQRARAVVELARREVAALLGVRPGEIVFTGSGTESVQVALHGLMEPGGVLATSTVEHAAVRELARRREAEDRAMVRWVGADAEGMLLLPAALEAARTAALMSVQWANNETGTIQPVREVGRACRAAGTAFHTDATQWVGKEPVPGDLADWCDALSFSAHKLHGPKGVGVLWVRPGVRLRPLVRGAQELGRHGGTENVPGIAGLGVAARAARAWLEGEAGACERARLGALRNAFESRLCERVPGAVLTGARAAGGRVWNTSSVSFPGVEAETLLVMLSEQRPEGVCASAGAACSSGSLEPSPVLTAMGLGSEVVAGAVRFSLSRFTTAEELERAAEIVVRAVEGARG
ncbi:MAG TPA: cysteine desulfurase family protein [Phycisphaerales bacterium]|nr:cysteine desulfurase family protein [Phycisphaerales bacterium]